MRIFKEITTDKDNLVTKQLTLARRTYLAVLDQTNREEVCRLGIRSRSLLNMSMTQRHFGNFKHVICFIHGTF